MTPLTTDKRPKNPYAIVGLEGLAKRTLTSDEMCEWIITLCAQYEGVTVEEVKGRSRVRCYVRPRQIAAYLSHKHTNLTLVSIGFKLGQKDHTTVIHSVRTIEDVMFYDKELKRAVAVIEAKILNETPTCKMSERERLYHENRHYTQGPQCNED
jgi:chromosomal replication initiation ATPase DnaA